MELFGVTDLVIVNSLKNGKITVKTKNPACFKPIDNVQILNDKGRNQQVYYTQLDCPLLDYLKEVIVKNEQGGELAKWSSKTNKENVRLNVDVAIFVDADGNITVNKQANAGNLVHFFRQKGESIIPIK
jgi:hypothetical protein